MLFLGEPLFRLCASPCFPDTQALAAMLGILIFHASQKFQRTVKLLDCSWTGTLAVLCLYLLIYMISWLNLLTESSNSTGGKVSAGLTFQWISFGMVKSGRRAWIILERQKTKGEESMKQFSFEINTVNEDMIVRELLLSTFNCVVPLELEFASFFCYWKLTFKC